MEAIEQIRRMQTWAVRPVESYVEDLRAPSARTRRQAAAALEVRRDHRGVPPLMVALGDEDPDVRWNAARALGALRDTQALEALVEALRDPVDTVREAVVEALWRIGDTAAIGPLTAALDDPSPNVRYHAARALVHPYYVRAAGSQVPLIARDGPDAPLYRRAHVVMRQAYEEWQEPPPET